MTQHRIGLVKEAMSSTYKNGLSPDLGASGSAPKVLVFEHSSKSSDDEPKQQKLTSFMLLCKTKTDLMKGYAA